MKLLRNIVIGLLLIGVGFFIRSVIPESQIAYLSSKITSSTNTSVLSADSSNPQSSFITYVNYDGKSFKPGYVTIKRSYLLAITNQSKTEKMWLESDNDQLNTTRAYGESERHQIELDKTGEFKVTNKLNPQASFFVKVVD